MSNWNFNCLPKKGNLDINFVRKWKQRFSIFSISWKPFSLIYETCSLFVFVYIFFFRLEDEFVEKIHDIVRLCLRRLKVRMHVFHLLSLSSFFRSLPRSGGNSRETIHTSSAFFVCLFHFPRIELDMANKAKYAHLFSGKTIPNGNLNGGIWFHLNRLTILFNLMNRIK